MEDQTCEECMWFDCTDFVCHNRESSYLLQERDLDDTCDKFYGGDTSPMKDEFCLIEMPLSQGKSWVKKVVDNDKVLYQNPSGGRMPVEGIVVVETVEAESFDDLDWTKTYLNISENGAGWLEPSGRFHGCPFQQHEGHAHRVLKRDSIEMEKQRWIRITNTEQYEAYYPLSPEQRMWLDRKGYDVEDDGHL